MLTQPNLQTVEQKAFMLFKEACVDDYKRTVLYIVYKAIEQNEGITYDMLKNKLFCEYSFDEATVKAAVGALTSTEIFDAVSIFRLSGNRHRPIVHLRKKKQSSIIQDWIQVLQEINHKILDFTSIKV